MNEETIKLLQAVATKLNDDYYVEIVETADIPFLGVSYAATGASTKGSRPVIEINPAAVWDGTKLLKVFLHEVAHIKHHWDYMTGVAPADRDSRDAMKREEEATMQALRWQHYAEHGAQKYMVNDKDARVDDGKVFLLSSSPGAAAKTFRYCLLALYDMSANLQALL